MDVVVPDQRSNPQLESFIEEINKSDFFADKNTEGSFACYLDFYTSNYPGMSRRFRAVGVIVIVLSAIIPLMSAISDRIPGGTLWLSIISVCIAIGTGVNSFFKWDNSWKTYVGAKLALEEAHNHYQLAIAEARMNADCQAGLEAGRKAAEDFIIRTGLIIETETKGYFSSQQTPAPRAQETAKT
jgi:hypothetical protein